MKATSPVAAVSVGASDTDVFCTKAEWKISGISQKIKECAKGQSLWSPEFSAAGLRNLQLEFFPRGRESATLDGFCSVFFWAPEGTHVKYELFVGSHRRAPDEDNYETRMGHGHSNFCLLSAEVAKDDSVTVGVEILDVEKKIAFGQSLIVTRPPLARLMTRFTAAVENRHVGRVEWRIGNMRRRLETLPKGASLYSPVFSAGGVRDILIEFYPNGNANTAKDGFCALYLRCPEGTKIFVTLVVGDVRKGPISARFDGNAGKGLPEFCELAPQLIDDSVLVAIEVKNPALAPYHPTLSADGKLAVRNL